MLLRQFDKAIEQQQSKIELLENTIPKLKDMPEKLSHVSIEKYNSVMYLPVKIYHTNEVLVSLGEDYFVETTCKKAIEIANSRRQFMQIELNKLQQTREKILQKYKDISLLQNKTENEDGSIDIKEPITLAQQEKQQEKAEKLKKRKKFVIKNQNSLEMIKDLEKKIQQSEQKRIKSIFEGINSEELEKMQENEEKMRIKVEKLKLQGGEIKELKKKNQDQNSQNLQTQIQTQNQNQEMEKLQQQQELNYQQNNKQDVTSVQVQNQQLQQQQEVVKQEKVSIMKKKASQGKKSVKFSQETEKNEEKKIKKSENKKEKKKPRDFSNIMDSIAPDESDNDDDSDFDDSDFSDSDLDYDKLNQKEESEDDGDFEDDSEDLQQKKQSKNTNQNMKDQQLGIIREVNENENEIEKQKEQNNNQNTIAQVKQTQPIKRNRYDKIIPGQKYTKEELNELFEQQVSSGMSFMTKSQYEEYLKDQGLQDSQQNKNQGQFANMPPPNMGQFQMPQNQPISTVQPEQQQSKKVESKPQKKVSRFKQERMGQ